MVMVTLATEDELSEAVGFRLLADVGLEVHQPLRRHGFGYLKKMIPNFLKMAERVPVVLLTDLDRTPCAPQLLRDWVGNQPRPRGLIFRVAVPELEAWLLADHSGLGVLFGKSRRPLNLPNQPESVPDAKAKLLQLAERHAPKEVRLDLVVKKGAVASQGLNYNQRLCPWVRDVWNPGEARERSPSLDRTMIRLAELAAEMGSGKH